MKNEEEDMEYSSPSDKQEADGSKRYVPESERLSLAYRASLQGRIGGDINDIKTLKQKNKLLKAAVLKEREGKAEVEAKLEQMRANYNDSMKQIEKKEESIIAQEQQIQQLKDSLLLERNNSTKYLDLYQKLRTQQMLQKGNGTQGGADEGESFFSGIGSIMGISQQKGGKGSGTVSSDLQKLQKENMILQEETQKAKMAALNAESRAKAVCADEAKKMWEEFSKKGELIQEQLRESKKHNTQIKEQLQKINEELDKNSEELLATQQMLSDTKLQLDKTLEKLHKVTNDFTFTDDQLKKTDLKLNNANKDIEKLTSQLAELKSERDQIAQALSTIEEKIMLFTLNRQAGLYIDKCQIICRVDLEGQHLMEFDMVKERFILNVLDIYDVICEYEPEPVLTLTLAKQNTLIFKSTSKDMKYAEKKIRQFVMSAPASKSLTRTVNANNKEQKGFVDNLYSFFK